MNFFKYIKTFTLILICSIALTTSSVLNSHNGVLALTPVNEAATIQDQNSTSLAIVANPKKYLNDIVTFNAKFDKFSTLGLDYKPAFKSSDEYISFLIKRDDSTYDIPISEMNLFIKKDEDLRALKNSKSSEIGNLMREGKKDEAEKFIDLKTNDEIQITGVVFSNALGDTWIDVNKLLLIKKAPEIKDGV